MGQIQTCGKHFRRGKSTFLQRIYWYLCLNQLVYLRNNGVFSGNNGQWLIANWNVNTSFPYGSTDALTNFSHLSRYSATIKRKFNKCRCSYYQNSTGDLAFKPNPGPTLSSQSQSRGNIHNYVDDLNSRNGSIGSRKHKMLLSCLSARSVRNKTVDIFYFICESKVDLIAITETWLTINDSAIKAELCPDGYKLMDHPRTLHRGGGTGLLFRDTLTVKIVDAGEMNG